MRQKIESCKSWVSKYYKIDAGVGDLVQVLLEYYKIDAGVGDLVQVLLELRASIMLIIFPRAAQTSET
jgi:hypothetical protein